MEKVIIAGSGCAGLTAAIYAARAELEPLVLAGAEFGGQLSETTSVENYPGFPDGVFGAQLMDEFKKQAEKFGGRIQVKEITGSELKNGGPHKLWTNDNEELECRSLIVATGARAKWLGLESEQALRNKGVSSCATCDGALYRDVPVAVVGGGDSAMEEAIFLSRFASKVTIIHRRDQLRASPIMQERVLANDKIEVQWNSVIDEVLDVEQDEVTGLAVKDVNTGDKSTIDVKGLFLAIGHIPNTEAFTDYLETDDDGYLVLCDGGESFTNIEGVFAAGDCADKRYRQAVTAAGMGCRAAIDGERWLQAQGL
ncbi:MAG: thioredoxin-disulfide reductase [Verrucomicrobiota bacterium]